MGRYTRYSATATVTINVPFSCVYCGFASQLEVTEKATTSRQVGGWGHSQDVAQREWALAHETAHKRGTSIAKDTAKLVPCKQCGKRNEGAVRSHVIFIVVASLVALGISGGLAYGVAAVDSTRPQVWMGIFSLLAFIVAIAIVFGGYTTYRDAPSKARFLDAQPAPAPAYAPALAPAPAPQPAQVLVRGPDGRQYPGVMVARAQGHVQVAFANGSTTWVPETGVTWAPRA